MSGVGITGNIKPLNGGNFTVFNGNPVANLAALALLQGGETGTQAWVQDQAEYYQLDVTNTFAVASPLVIAAAGGGRWFKRNKAYVIGNYTLWCQSYGFGIVGFTPGQQLATSNAEPDIKLDMSALLGVGNQQGLFIDALNNVWLIVNTSFATGVDAYKFSLSKCLVSGTPTPDINIKIALTGGDQTESAIAVFDRLNNGLWIADGGHGGTTSRMRHFGPKACEYTLPVFDSTIIVGGAAMSNQQDAVMDGRGNLWGSVAVSAGGFNGGIFMFTAAQLAAGGSVVPSVVWLGTNLTGAGLSSTCGMAVGPDNLLWVANYANGTGLNIRAWDMTQPSGNPVPSIILTAAAFNGPYWLEFDPAGNLWVNNGNANGLMRIPKAQLAASGAVTPDIILTPAVTALTSKFAFPKNPDRVGLLPSGSP